MKVLFVSYPASFQNIGGGEIVLLKMREHLQKLGVEVKLFDMWRDRVERFDLVHVFGTVKDCLGLVRVAKARRVPVAVTPIFWSSWRRALYTYGSPAEKAGLLLRHAAKVCLPALPSDRRRMLCLADRILPNSKMESDQIRRLFGIPAERMSVVYNGVDRRFAQAEPGLFKARYGIEGEFILSVGRLEPRKNQLNLIRAARRLGAPRLVLVGDTVSGFESYERACRAEAKGVAEFIPAIDHEDPLLASAYAACRLCVLPGWFETPGLAALEAALAGSPLAVTEAGSAREYFADEASYFDPSNPEAMAEAMRQRLRRGASSFLKQSILERFIWESVAGDTLRIYGELAAGKEADG